MLPPLLLDVQPSHTVLDICAAPGSKTSQLLEDVMGHDGSSVAGYGGVVVANDPDRNRASMLAHRINTLRSPCTLVSEATVPRLSLCISLSLHLIFASSRSSGRMATMVNRQAEPGTPASVRRPERRLCFAPSTASTSHIACSYTPFLSLSLNPLCTRL